MEYTPQQQMFETKRIQILSMYNNAPEILKGNSEDELEQEEEELTYEEENEEEVEKGEGLGGELVKSEEEEENSEDEEETEEEVEKGEEAELTKAEAFEILGKPFEI